MDINSLLYVHQALHIHCPLMHLCLHKLSVQCTHVYVCVCAGVRSRPMQPATPHLLALGCADELLHGPQPDHRVLNALEESSGPSDGSRHWGLVL